MLMSCFWPATMETVKARYLTLGGALQFPGGPLSQINKKSWNRVTMQPAGMFQNIGSSFKQFDTSRIDFGPLQS